MCWAALYPDRRCFARFFHTSAGWSGGRKRPKKRSLKRKQRKEKAETCDLERKREETGKNGRKGGAALPPRCANRSEAGRGGTMSMSANVGWFSELFGVVHSCSALFDHMDRFVRFASCGGRRGHKDYVRRFRPSVLRETVNHLQIRVWRVTGSRIKLGSVNRYQAVDKSFRNADVHEDV